MALEKVSEKEVEKAIKLLRYTTRIYLIGNGGSSSIASHFANDLNKVAKKPAICLSDNVPIITAIGNDIGYEHIFSEQVKNFMHPPDVLVAISSSGNSPNILKAIRVAKKMKIKVIVFVGFSGRIRGLSVDAKIHVPSFDYGIVEPAHDAIAHYITNMLK